MCCYNYKFLAWWCWAAIVKSYTNEGITMSSTSFYFRVITSDGLMIKYFGQSADSTLESKLEEAERMCKACNVTFNSLV